MKKSSVARSFRVNLLAVGAAVLIMTFSSGCALALIGLGAGAGIAGTAYYEGKLTGTLEATPQEIKDATEAAFKELDIKLISTTANALEGKVTGKTQSDKDVTVSIELEKDGKSKVGVRVGTFGDQPLSEKIYSAITKNLPKKDSEKDKK